MVIFIIKFNMAYIITGIVTVVLEGLGCHVIASGVSGPRLRQETINVIACIFVVCYICSSNCGVRKFLTGLLCLYLYHFHV